MDVELTIVQEVPHYVTVSVMDRVPREPAPLLIALHGYAGDMGSMLRLARDIAENDMIVASIQGPHQFWFPTPGDESRRVGFGWLTPFRAGDSQARHHALVTRVIEELRAGYDADSARVFLLGFSQACALNYRFAFTHPGVLKGVIGVCGGIPGDFHDPRYRPIETAVLHIAATRDHFYKIEHARCFEGELSRLAADVTFAEYDAPHVFPRRSVPEIRRWILARC
jgi:predicted esterase